MVANYRRAARENSVAYRITPLARALLCTAILTISGCAALPLPVGTLAPDPVRADEEYRQGLAHTQGIGVPQNYARGVKSFKQAARLGSADAAYMTGMAYLIGRGVTPDLSSAVRWLEVANRAGHSGATYQLGKLYIKGQGVTQDQAWGALLLGLAAGDGHSQAMLELAICYRAGIGLPVDPGMAWYWADTSDRADASQTAKAVSNKLRELSSDAQRTRATSRAASARRGTLDLASATYAQQQLSLLGYRPGGIDGLWGPASARALEAFRNAESLPHRGPPGNTDLLQLRLRSLQR